MGIPPPAVILGTPVVPAEGGTTPSRRHSRHPSRPRRRRDDWGVGNPVALASSTFCRFTSARLAPAPVRIKEGGDAPPAVILGTPVVHAEGGTTGVSGIQWLLQVAPTVVSPQRVLLQPPSGSKKAGMPLPPSGSKQVGIPLPPSGSKQVGIPPPAVILDTPVVPAEGGTTGVSGIQWLLQVAPTVVSPQRVLLQPPSGSKQVGIPPPAVILGTPVVPACPYRRHGLHFIPKTWFTLFPKA